MRVISMNPVRLAVIVVLVLFVGVGLGYWVSGKRHGSPDASAPEGRRILYWHDPMVPGQRFEKPGKSPFMDMQLVPVYADEATTSPAVQVSASVVQSLG